VPDPVGGQVRVGAPASSQAMIALIATVRAIRAAMAVTLAFGYACSWLMAYIGLTIRNSEAIRAAIYIVVFPMTPTSSVFLPTQTIPGWLAASLRRAPAHHHHRQRARPHPRPPHPPHRPYRRRRSPAGPRLDRRHPRPVRPLAIRSYGRNAH